MTSFSLCHELLAPQRYHKQPDVSLIIGAFHKDDISLIWQSGHEFIICSGVMPVHSYDVIGSTVYFFVVFM